MKGGWIKLHRKIWDNPIVTKSPERLAIWIYLLTEAAHSPHDITWKGQRITLQPGQLITGRKKIAEQLNVSESMVFRTLNEFKIDHQIEQQTDSHGSLISILAWNKYQVSEQQNEQQMNSQRTANEQPANSQRTQHKNDKNEKEERNRNIKTNADKVGLSTKEFIRLTAEAQREGLTLAEYLTRRNT